MKLSRTLYVSEMLPIGTLHTFPHFCSAPISSLTFSILLY
jgi:hypothetical protein